MVKFRFINYYYFYFLKSFDRFRGNNRGHYTLEELNQETKKKFDIEFIDEKLFKMGKNQKIGKGFISFFFIFF